MWGLAVDLPAICAAQIAALRHACLLLNGHACRLGQKQALRVEACCWIRTGACLLLWHMCHLLAMFDWLYGGIKLQGRQCCSRLRLQ